MVSLKTKGPLETETTPSPSPEPGCFFWQRKNKKGNKKSKKCKKKIAKVASPPCSQVVSPPPVRATQMYRTLLQEQVDPPEYLQTASLSISYGAQVHKTGLSYELTDHERPPSRSYGCPGRRVEMDPLSCARRMVWMDLHPERIDSLEQRLKLNTECRHRALEARIMRAYRIKEQRQHKFRALMENTELSSKQLTQRRKVLAWKLENTRPGTPDIYQPPSSLAFKASHPSSLPGINEAEDTCVGEAVLDKQLKAEQVLRLAKEKQLAKALCHKERHEKCHERRLALERERALDEEELERYQTSTEACHVEGSNLHKTSADFDISPANQPTMIKEIEKTLDNQPEKNWDVGASPQLYDLSKSTCHIIKSANDKVAGGDTTPRGR